MTLEVDLPASLRVLADPDGLNQVFGKLLQNALRYTPAPGRVGLRGERRRGEVRIHVSNSGPGIPAADLPHVFERFYRVESSRDVASGGAGIGLAIVRELVRSFGGSVGTFGSRTDGRLVQPAGHADTAGAAEGPGLSRGTAGGDPNLRLLRSLART